MMNNLIRGTPSIGMRTIAPPNPTLPPPDFATPPDQIVQEILAKMDRLETVVEKKADSDSIRSYIAMSDEMILISAQQIVLDGEVTIGNIIRHQNGTLSGELPPEVTRIVGDVIQTGTIRSNNWGPTSGSAWDLNNGIMIMGGSESPSLYFEDGNLFLSGSLTAESVVLGKGTLGEIADAANESMTEEQFEQMLNDQLAQGVENIIAGETGDFRLEVGESSIFARHALFDQAGTGGPYTGDLRTALYMTSNGLAMGYNDRATGAFVPAITIESTGEVTVRGELTAGSVVAGSVTVNGTTLEAIRLGAEGALPSDEFLSTLDDALAEGVGSIIAGDDGNYRLEVGASSIVARHAQFSQAGTGAYTGTLRTGLVLNASGIAMGYNQRSNGAFVPAIAISSTGNVTISGTLTAGSVIAGTATVDGVNMSSIRAQASNGASHAGQTGNPHGTSLAQVNGDLDDIADGAAYYKTTYLQRQGAGRASIALDSENDYIRQLSTQKIAVSGTNPLNGIVIDAAGFRAYQAGSQTVNISAVTGASSWGGDVATNGRIVARGATATTFGQVTIHASPINNNVHGLVGESGSLQGVVGATNTGVGVYGVARAAGGIGVEAAASRVQDIALNIGLGRIQKQRISGHILDVWDASTGTLVGTFEYSFRAA